MADRRDAAAAKETSIADVLKTTGAMLEKKQANAASAKKVTQVAPAPPGSP